MPAGSAENLKTGPLRETPRAGISKGLVGFERGSRLLMPDLQRQWIFVPANGVRLEVTVRNLPLPQVIFQFKPVITEMKHLEVL